MNKQVTKKDNLYKEALAWMSYRYAMGMTDNVGRKGYSEFERYRQFMDIEFGSDEFRALVNAFCEFLKSPCICNSRISTSVCHTTWKKYTARWTCSSPSSPKTTSKLWKNS